MFLTFFFFFFKKIHGFGYGDGVAHPLLWNIPTLEQVGAYAPLRRATF